MSELTETEWQDEMCFAAFNEEGGFWCGYIAVPPGHPWFGADDTDERAWRIECHGGVTYGRDYRPYAEPDGNWWIGFDCAHFGDRTKHSLGGEFRDLDYVKGQIAGMKRQAVVALREGQE